MFLMFSVLCFLLVFCFMLLMGFFGLWDIRCCGVGLLGIAATAFGLVLCGPIRDATICGWCLRRRTIRGVRRVVRRGRCVVGGLGTIVRPGGLRDGRAGKVVRGIRFVRGRLRHNRNGAGLPNGRCEVRGAGEDGRRSLLRALAPSLGSDRTLVAPELQGGASPEPEPHHAPE